MHPRVLALTALLTALSGCAVKIDRYLVNGPIGAALSLPDVDMACRSANGTVPLAESLVGKNKSWRARVILNVTAGVCAQEAAMEAELQAERALFWLEGEERLGAVKDARAYERRQRTRSAARGWRAFQLMEEAIGPIGADDGSCPKLAKKEEELAYFIGIVGGANALLDDQAGGGQVGIPIDLLRQVGRASTCLDDARWWGVPKAIEASVWAMVPGTAPDGVDPWQALDEAASRGEAEGVHIARAMHARVAANAGNDEQVLKAIAAFEKETPAPPPGIALLEDYGRLIAQHEADLVWTRARGYRAESLGPVPGDGSGGAAGSAGDDPFQGDPFAEGGDPFATDSSDDTDTPDPETP